MENISQTDCDKLLEYVLKHFLPKNLHKDTKTENYWKQFLDQNTNLFRSNSFANEFKKNMNITGTKSDDFKNKIVFINEFPIIMGIRFRNLHPNYPFIDIIPSCDISSPDIYKKLSQMAYDSYRIFNVNKLRMKCQQNYLDLIDSNINYQIDFGYYANQIENCTHKNFIHSIKLELTDPTLIYDQMNKEFSDFQNEFQFLKNHVTIDPLENYQESYKENLFFSATLNGQTIGFISGGITQYFGNLGVLINSEILLKKYRKRGFGKIIQNLFIKKLFSTKKYPNFLVHGTINEKNIPSIKTALNNNRFPHLYEVFFKIENEAN